MIRTKEPKPYIEVDGEILPPNDNLEGPCDADIDQEAREAWYEQMADSEAESIKPPHELVINPVGYNTLRYEGVYSPPVTIAVGHAAILAAAKMYASKAGSNGLKEAATLPEHRQKLDKRYPGKTDRVVERSQAKNHYTYDEERRTIAPAIGVDADDWVNGRLPRNQEAIAQYILSTVIRPNIGVNAGRKKRNAYTKPMRRTNKSSK